MLGIQKCPVRCKYSPCKCCEYNLKNHCENTCHANGCDQCNDGTTRFKWNYQYYCEKCEDIFGDACLFCQDTNGCGQCESGYDRVKDDVSGLYYCNPQYGDDAYVEYCGELDNGP